MVVAIVNNKGGVGKTTVAVNLAAALARTGRRVLLVDLDSQASASRWFGVDRARLVPSIASCLLDDFPVHRAVRETAVPDVDLLTGSIELASADIALCDLPGREARLEQLLAQLRGAYDVILLDCAPSLSLVCVNALVAADAFLVPVTHHFLALEGVVSLLAAVDRVRIRLGHKPKLLGIVLTMVTRHPDGAALERLPPACRDRLFRTRIPLAPALETASRTARTIFDVAPQSRTADAFTALAEELLERQRGHH